MSSKISGRFLKHSLGLSLSWMRMLSLDLFSLISIRAPVKASYLRPKRWIQELFSCLWAVCRIFWFDLTTLTFILILFDNYPVSLSSASLLEKLPSFNISLTYLSFLCPFVYLCLDYPSLVTKALAWSGSTFGRSEHFLTSILNFIIQHFISFNNTLLAFVWAQCSLRSISLLFL